MKLKKREILILGILILALGAWALWTKSGGTQVCVKVDGERVLEKSLAQSGNYSVQGYGGFSLNLVVEKGQVHVENSTCPDLICENHAPISKAGEQIVCLPGRVVISVTGQEGTVDASTG